MLLCIKIFITTMFIPYCNKNLKLRLSRNWLSTKIFTKILIISLLTSESIGHTPQNTSDVIIYRDQPEPAQDAVFYTTGQSPHIKATTTDDDFIENKKETHKQDEIEKHRVAEQKDEVLFVPTEGPIFLDVDGIHEDTIRMADVLEKKNLPGRVTTTEPPEQESVLFIQGKNDERQDNPRSEERRRGRGGRRHNMDDDDEILTTTKNIALDCVNLDCDNNIDSVCGAKVERKEWKYRLFLNECYFRKVNCMFNFESNRYSQVELSFCKNADVHEARRNNQPYHYQPYVYHPMPDKSKGTKKDEQQPKRRMESRRAMAMEMGGGYCGHTCPTSCSDFYKPECALSLTGERRTFANHCQLDRVSCRTNTLWRRRPLSECVGGKKADMHQNRAFIGWMQKVGIVDNRGRVKLDESVKK